jgi:hypothetical protein
MRQNNLQRTHHCVATPFARSSSSILEEWNACKQGFLVSLSTEVIWKDLLDEEAVHRLNNGVAGFHFSCLDFKRLIKVRDPLSRCGLLTLLSLRLAAVHHIFFTDHMDQ